MRQFDALTATKELFHVCYWLAHTYSTGAKPAAGLTFDPASAAEAASTARPDADRRPTADGWNRNCASATRSCRRCWPTGRRWMPNWQRLREEVAAAKKANTATPDTHDYSEAETRDFFIDLLLKEAGWALDQPQDREYEVTGMPNAEGKGFVDYVLWGDDGKPLGLVEAKRTKRDARVGQQQAKLYADCLEKQFGQRPVIFYSNGYDHWLWDDTSYPPRPVQGFYKKAELELLIQRRTTRKALADAPINDEHRRTLLPDARHPPHRRNVRAGPPAQGAGRDGDRRRQDPHGHRAVRPADALQLGRSGCCFSPTASRW